MSAEHQPYQWPKSSGLLTARLLRDYMTWLATKLDLEWESPGVIKRPSRRSDQKPKEKVKPYQFRKSRGLLTIQKDIRPFARYVLAKLKPWSDRHPFLPRRKEGLALVQDLRAFADHVNLLLKKKKEEQSKQKASS